MTSRRRTGSAGAWGEAQELEVQDEVLRGSGWLIMLQGRPFCSGRPMEVPGVEGTGNRFRAQADPDALGSKLTLGWVGRWRECQRWGAGSGVYIYHGNKVNLGIWLEPEGIGTTEEHFEGLECSSLSQQTTR